LSKKPFLKTDYIGILVDDSLPLSTQHPLHDKQVRQALNYSIDRRAMVKYLRNNSVFDGVFGYVPPGMPGFSDIDSLVRYDLEKARKLLSEAGYPEGKGIPRVAISTTSDYTDLMEFLQHQWAKIGFQIEVEVLSGPGHREKVSSSSALMFRKSWLADYADAENFLSNFTSWNHSPGGANYTHFCYRPFDSLYVQAQQLSDDSSRFAAYRRMNEIIAEEVPVIPLFYDQVTHFIRSDVQGLPTNAVNMLDLTRTRKTVK
jgi:peptide/nickel transport system substrate-binding protein